VPNALTTMPLYPPRMACTFVPGLRKEPADSIPRKRG